MFPSGEVHYFEGPKGEERWLRAECPDGQVNHYEGPKGEERLVKAQWADLAERYAPPLSLPYI